MTLFKRHIGRRVAGVGVGVALLMLGLEAPAFAAAPTIASVSPTSGPAATATGGCVVVVTGTNFNNPNVPASGVTFVQGANSAPATRTIISGTEMWVTVPTLAAGAPADLVAGPAAIQVDNGSPPVATAAFTITAAGTPGGCAPTITSFLPPCGPAGTVVTITGTNLLKGDSPTGGDVRFSPYGDTEALGFATHTNTGAESPTSLQVLVPSGAADGPIRVSTYNNTIAEGATLSTTIFAVPPPDCPVVGGETHARSVSLSLRKHLVARGKVSVGDGFTDCAAAVPVKIQRRVSGHWKTVGSTTTSDTGAYKKRIRDRAGKYRAKAPKVSLGTPVTDICSGATSPVRRHTH